MTEGRCAEIPAAPPGPLCVPAAWPRSTDARAGVCGADHGAEGTVRAPTGRPGLRDRRDASGLKMEKNRESE